MALSTDESIGTGSDEPWLALALLTQSPISLGSWLALIRARFPPFEPQSTDPKPPRLFPISPDRPTSLFRDDGPSFAVQMVQLPCMVLAQFLSCPCLCVVRSFVQLAVGNGVLVA